MELRSGLQKSCSFLIPVRVCSPSHLSCPDLSAWEPSSLNSSIFLFQTSVSSQVPPPLFLDEDDALWNKKVAGSCLMGLLSIMAGSTRAEPARFQDGHRRPSHWVVNSIRAGILSLLLACGTPGPSTLLASQRHLPSVAE